MQGPGGVDNRAQVGIEVQPRLAHAAHEFEAQMMKELIRPMMRLGEDDDSSGSGGALTDFAGEALGQSLSRAGGFRIADTIMAALSQNETGHRSHSESAPAEGWAGN